MPSEEKNKLYVEILESIDLTLMNRDNTYYKTNYRKGIIPTAFIAARPCIYNGSGLVIKTLNSYIITSDNKVKLRDYYYKVDAKIIIPLPTDIDSLTPFLKYLFKELEYYSAIEEKIRWYAFGELCLNDSNKQNIFTQLIVENIEWFYIATIKSYSNKLPSSGS